MVIQGKYFRTLRRTRLAVLLLFVMLVTAGMYLVTANANQPKLHFATRAQSLQYNELSHEIYCVACENKSLAQANTNLARTFRQQLVTMISKDQTNQQIISYFIAHYGDLIRVTPPIDRNTVVFWMGPLILLVIGIISTFFIIRKHHNA